MIHDFYFILPIHNIILNIDIGTILHYVKKPGINFRFSCKRRMQEAIGLTIWFFPSGKHCWGSKIYPKVTFYTYSPHPICGIEIEHNEYNKLQSLLYKEDRFFYSIQ
jgi:hypothetical protein